MGKIVHRPAKLDKKLTRELKSLADPTEDPYDTVIGKTMCTHDFYEGKFLYRRFLVIRFFFLNKIFMSFNFREIVYTYFPIYLMIKCCVYLCYPSWFCF